MDMKNADLIGGIIPHCSLSITNIVYKIPFTKQKSNYFQTFSMLGTYLMITK